MQGTKVCFLLNEGTSSYIRGLLSSFEANAVELMILVTGPFIGKFLFPVSGSSLNIPAANVKMLDYFFLIKALIISGIAKPNLFINPLLQN